MGKKTQLFKKNVLINSENNYMIIYMTKLVYKQIKGGTTLAGN